MPVTERIDFTNLTVNKTTEFVSLPGDQQKVLTANRAFYTGDHWQNNDGWIGQWPIPPEGVKEGVAALAMWMQTQIRRGFLSKNAIKECTDREVAGTVGIEPRWGFAPIEIELPANATPDSEAAKAAVERAHAKAQRAEDLATRWWDRNGAHSHLQALATRLLYGASDVPGVAVSSGRFYIPTAMLTDEVIDGKATGRRVLRVESIEDALDKIHFETLDADQGRVVTDPETLAEIGIKPTKRLEESVAEVTYLDPSSDRARPLTILATIRSTGAPSIKLDLGGRLTMMTVSRREFLTEQGRQAQKGLNFATSMVRRNVETGGFLEEIILNAHIPGHYEGVGDARRYVADPIERGPLALNAFSGIEIENADGTKTLTTPQVIFRQPVDPTPTIKAKAEHYADVLDGCHQKHVLISGDATASGESRIQARADYIADLRLTQAPIEKFGRWMIETVVLLADALVLASGGQASRPLDGLRASFSCYLDAGPVDPAERAQNLAEMKEGALSKTSTIERNGIVDVDAELTRIGGEPNAGLDAEEKRATIYAAWVKGGVGEAFAAKRAGLSADEIKELTTAQTDIVPVAQ